MGHLRIKYFRVCVNECPRDAVRNVQLFARVRGLFVLSSSRLTGFRSAWNVCRTFCFVLFFPKFERFRVATCCVASFFETLPLPRASATERRQVLALARRISSLFLARPVWRQTTRGDGSDHRRRSAEERGAGRAERSHAAHLGVFGEKHCGTAEKKNKKHKTKQTRCV